LSICQDVFCQLLNPRLDSITDKFIIHEYSEFYQDYGNACVIDNQLFCVWSDSRNPEHGYDIYGRIYDIAKFTSLKYYRANERKIDGYSLHQNFPNPFNSLTMIKYELPQAGKIYLHIYDLLGRKIKSFETVHDNLGQYSITWDGKNDHTKSVASGVYFYKLKTANFCQIKKMILFQ